MFAPGARVEVIIYPDTNYRRFGTVTALVEQHACRVQFDGDSIEWFYTINALAPINHRAGLDRRVPETFLFAKEYGC